MKAIKKFIRNEQGATAIEYGLIASLIGIAVIGSASLAGDSIGGLFSSVGNTLKAQRIDENQINKVMTPSKDVLAFDQQFINDPLPNSPLGLTTTLPSTSSLSFGSEVSATMAARANEAYMAVNPSQTNFNPQKLPSFGAPPQTGSSPSLSTLGPLGFNAFQSPSFRPIP